jgi:hypothetical protein
MMEIHRREMLGALLSYAAVAAAGSALMLGVAEAAPLIINQDVDAPTEDFVQQVWWRRRRVCWWHRGRRICRWRRW